jgi:hypothetical protein
MTGSERSTTRRMAEAICEECGRRAEIGPYGLCADCDSKVEAEEEWGNFSGACRRWKLEKV